MKSQSLLVFSALCTLVMGSNADAACVKTKIHECTLGVVVKNGELWKCETDHRSGPTRAKTFYGWARTASGAKAQALIACENHYNCSYGKDEKINSCRSYVDANPGSMVCEVGEIAVCDQIK